MPPKDTSCPDHCKDDRGSIWTIIRTRASRSEMRWTLGVVITVLGIMLGSLMYTDRTLGADISRVTADVAILNRTVDRLVTKEDMREMTKEILGEMRRAQR